MKVLHFLEDSAPSASEVNQAQVARAADIDYQFVSAAWAVTGEVIPCDKVVTENAEIIGKYKGKAQYAPPKPAEEKEPVELEAAE